MQFIQILTNALAILVSTVAIVRIKPIVLYVLALSVTRESDAQVAMLFYFLLDYVIPAVKLS